MSGSLAPDLTALSMSWAAEGTVLNSEVNYFRCNIKAYLRYMDVLFLLRKDSLQMYFPLGVNAISSRSKSMKLLI